MKMCDESGLVSENKIQHVALISAKTGYGVEGLVTKLMVDWDRKGDVYILGCTNVGKSTLFNALLKSDYCKETAKDYINRATTSVWPGTTLNLLKFPVIRTVPYKIAKRAARLRRQRDQEKEEVKMEQMRYKKSERLGGLTLMGHIGQTFEGYTNLAVTEEDSKGFSGPTFTFHSHSNEVVTKKYDQYRMLGHKYNEKRYPDSKWCYDTPGVVNPHQIINLLTQHELSVILSKETIIPRSFIIKPGQSMLVSGLARIDYPKGERPVYFTVFAAAKIPVNVRDIVDMDDFYNRYVGTPTLGVPIGDNERLARLPRLEGREMEVTGQSLQESAADVLLSSIGWAAVTPPEGFTARLTVYTPGGLGSGLRTPSLLPYAINLRGKRSHAQRGKKRPASYKIKPLPAITGDEYS